MGIIIEPYNPRWPAMYEAIRRRLWDAVHDVALGIEHVGSTSVPGLWAKPIIDIDIIIESRDSFEEISRRLEQLGYIHLGQLGIPDRDAFRAGKPETRHNLYVCPDNCLPLKNHLALREYLRSDPEGRAAYSDLKRKLAEKFTDDIDSYIDGKTEFITGILRIKGFSPAEIEQVTSVNKLP